MGMFDTMRSADGREWQTKAFDSVLAIYRIGDRLPEDATEGNVTDYQVEVLGDGPEFVTTYATIRDGALAEVPSEQDPSLPLLGYYGGPFYRGGVA